MTILSDESSELCGVCGLVEARHDDQIRHEFSPEGNLRQKPPPRSDTKPTLSSGDPILRIALIRKGILTPDELSAAEEDFQHARSTGEPLVIIANPPTS